MSANGADAPESPLLLSTMRATLFSSTPYCAHLPPAAALALVRRSTLIISTVAPEKAAAVTWAASLLYSCSVVAFFSLLRSKHCCLFVSIKFTLYPFVWSLPSLFYIVRFQRHGRRATTQTTWSTPHASTYWDMRLSVAGSAKDAKVQSGIFFSDFTRNNAVVGRQPHPGPNFASYVLPGRPHRLAVALPRAA